MVNFPLRNLNPAMAERAQARSHIIRNGAKVFANHARCASLCQSNAQIFLALPLIRVAVFGRFVVTWCEMRRATASSREHFLPIKRQKLFVLPRSPGKCVDAIKSEHVIDAKEVENASDGPYTLAPPFEVVRTHPVPAIERNPPILSPFLRKLVILKIWFGRCASGPVEREFIRPRENVCAVITDTEWNIAHQCNSAFFSIKFDLTPLFMGYPLHIAEEILSIPQGCLSILRQIVQPVARALNGLMFG